MKGIEAPQITGKVIQNENLGNSKLLLIKNKPIFKDNS
jgi:hypothetical protein